MIIFYNKKTGDIFGTIEGRVHSEHELTKMTISPDSVNKKDIGKFVVPMKPNYVEVEKPKIRYILPDENKPVIKQIIVGKKKVKVIQGLLPDGELAEKFFEFEKKQSELYKRKLKLDENGKVKGII